MGRILNAVVDYLTDDDWKYTILDGESALMLSFRGRSGSWQCFARADETRECFVFYSVLPPHASEGSPDLSPVCQPSIRGGGSLRKLLGVQG